VDYEHGLNLCIREIRAVLDDDADKPRYVETLPRVGYRFLAHVEEVASQADSAVSAAQKGSVSGQNPDADRAAEPPKKLPSRQWALSGGISLVVLALIIICSPRIARTVIAGTSSALIESLAVLPLENLSGDQEQQYFADGMTDELITELRFSMRIPSPSD